MDKTLQFYFMNHIFLDYDLNKFTPPKYTMYEI